MLVRDRGKLLIFKRCSKFDKWPILVYHFYHALDVSSCNDNSCRHYHTPLFYQRKTGTKGGERGRKEGGRRANRARDNKMAEVEPLLLDLNCLASRVPRLIVRGIKSLEYYYFPWFPGCSFFRFPYFFLFFFPLSRATVFFITNFPSLSFRSTRGARFRSRNNSRTPVPGVSCTRNYAR